MSKWEELARQLKPAVEQTHQKSDEQAADLERQMAESKARLDGLMTRIIEAARTVFRAFVSGLGMGSAPETIQEHSRPPLVKCTIGRELCLMQMNPTHGNGVTVSLSFGHTRAENKEFSFDTLSAEIEEWLGNELKTYFSKQR